jgi:hypothetical protein
MSWIYILCPGIKNPVNYVQIFPMLKYAAESYTNRMYKEFEEDLKM